MAEYPENPEKRGGGGLFGLLLAHIVCCGGILLLATGALGAFGAWFVEDGLIWLAVGGAAVAAAFLVRRRPHGFLRGSVTRAPGREPD